MNFISKSMKLLHLAGPGFLEDNYSQNQNDKEKKGKRKGKNEGKKKNKMKKN